MKFTEEYPYLEWAFLESRSYGLCNLAEKGNLARAIISEGGGMQNFFRIAPERVRYDLVFTSMPQNYAAEDIKESLIEYIKNIEDDEDEEEYYVEVED